jgi:hypothetical protein
LINSGENLNPICCRAANRTHHSHNALQTPQVAMMERYLLNRCKTEEFTAKYTVQLSNNTTVKLDYVLGGITGISQASYCYKAHHYI